MSGPSKTPEVDRRDFVKIVTTLLGMVMGLVVGLPGIGYLISPALRTQRSETWVSLGTLGDYPIGIPTPFSFTRKQVNGWEKTVLSYGVYVLRKDDTKVNVFSNICTHLGCKVKWHADIQEYVSPCHDGHFDIDGYVTKGPPPRPLDQFETKIESGNLFIRLVA